MQRQIVWRVVLYVLLWPWSLLRRFSLCILRYLSVPCCMLGKWWLSFFLMVLDTVPFDWKFNLRKDSKLLASLLLDGLSYMRMIAKNEYHGWDVFQNHVTHEPDNMALIFVKSFPSVGRYLSIETFTYNSLYQIILRLSYILYYEYHVREEDHIGIFYKENNPLSIFIWLSLWNIGAIPVFLNFDTEDSNKLTNLLKCTNTITIFTDLELSKTHSKLFKNLRNVKINVLYDHSCLKVILDKSSPTFLQTAIRRKQATLSDLSTALIYSSYIDGDIKLSFISWRKAILNNMILSRFLHVDENSVIFSQLPIYKPQVSLSALWLSILQGSCFSTSSYIPLTEIPKQLFLSRATHFHFEGEMIRELVSYPPLELETLHNVKVAYGQGLRNDIWNSFENRFRIPIIRDIYDNYDNNNILPIINTYQKFGDKFIYGKLFAYINGYFQKLIDIETLEKHYDIRDEHSLANQHIDKQFIMTNLRNNKNYCSPIIKIFSPTEKRYIRRRLSYFALIYPNTIRGIFRKNDLWFRCPDFFTVDNKGFLYLIGYLKDSFFVGTHRILSMKIEDEMQTIGKDDISRVIIIDKKQLINNIQNTHYVAYIKLKNFAKFDINSNNDYKNSNIFIINKLLHKLKHVLHSWEIPQFIEIINEIKLHDDYTVCKKYYKDLEFPFNENSTKSEIYWRKDNDGDYTRLSIKEWNNIA